MTEPDVNSPDMTEPEASTGEEVTAPTAEQRERRRVKANRATRGGLAAVICLEALVVLLAPRAIAQTAAGLSTTKTVTLLVLAAVLIVAGVLMRRPWGIGVGSVLQLVFLASCAWIPIELIPAALLVGCWLYLLNVRHDLVGTPGGARMLIS